MASEIVRMDDLRGQTISMEELCQRIERVTVGWGERRLPRGKTVARRLRPILELVERGPNGSLGHGSRWRVVPPPPKAVVGEVQADGDDEVPTDSGYLAAAVRRMTGED